MLKLFFLTLKRERNMTVVAWTLKEMEDSIWGDKEECPSIWETWEEVDQPESSWTVKTWVEWELIPAKSSPCSSIKADPEEAKTSDSAALEWEVWELEWEETKKTKDNKIEALQRPKASRALETSVTLANKVPISISNDMNTFLNTMLLYIFIFSDLPIILLRSVL